ncbi:MAG TPA: choice-of-anchor L domain-containing protein, partial [Bacteroidia bacterium]|nr:choice-of-anchor L domain-containing protein [Bacteroidia bacterium]
MKKLQSLPVRAALLLFVVFAGNIKAQLTTTRNGNYASMTYLVNNVLLGNSGITATNITYQGIDSSFGFFNGSASNIGMDTGIIMCNGGINIAAGPNQKTYGDVKDGKWTTFDQSTTDGWANAAKYQDADLAALAKTNIANTFS